MEGAVFQTWVVLSYKTMSIQSGTVHKAAGQEASLSLDFPVLGSPEGDPEIHKTPSVVRCAIS